MGNDRGFQFTDDAVPREYDELLVPRLFEPWAALLLIFAGGIAQAARALSASPLAPSLAALPATAQEALNAAVKTHLAPLFTEERVSGYMTANIAVARISTRPKITCASSAPVNPRGGLP